MAIYPINIDSFYDYQLEQSLNELSNVRGLLQESYLTEGVVGTIIRKIRKLWDVFRGWLGEKIKILKEKLAKLRKKKDPFDFSATNYTWNDKWRNPRINLNATAQSYPVIIIPANLTNQISDFSKLTVFSTSNIDKILKENDIDKLNDVIEEVHQDKLNQLHSIMKGLDKSEVDIDFTSTTMKDFFMYCKRNFDTLKKDYKNKIEVFYDVFNVLAYNLSYLQQDQILVEKKLDNMIKQFEEEEEEETKEKLQFSLHFVQMCVAIYKQHFQTVAVFNGLVTNSYLNYKTMIESFRNTQEYITKTKGKDVGKFTRYFLMPNFNLDPTYDQLANAKAIYQL